MFLSFRVSLTPVTILCRAVLENANAISIHVAGFKHKIYRWLCFCHLWVAYRDGARKNSRLLLLCRVVIKMSVMQIFAKLIWGGFGVLVTKSSSMHCWYALGWKCSEVQNLDSIFFCDSEEKEKMFLFPLLSHQFCK